MKEKTDKSKNVKQRQKKDNITRNFDASDCYFNIELSWLAFNSRVLDQAKSIENPLLERFKFLAITSTNLDEFFMVRIGGIYDKVEYGDTTPEISGMTPKKEIEKICSIAHDMVEEQYELYFKLISELRQAGIEICRADSLSDECSANLDEYFYKYLYPALTPLAVDASRPFPLVQSRSLNIGLIIETDDETERFATVQAPSTMQRLVMVAKNKYVFIEDVIIRYLDVLFTGCKILDVCPYRITRDADYSIDEKQTLDVLREIERSIRRRPWGAAMRLETNNTESSVTSTLKKALEIADNEVYQISGPINLAFCMKLDAALKGDEYKFAPFKPRLPAYLHNEKLYPHIAKKDILLHHPYETFDPVVEFVKKAANDESVLAIKQTLYRVSGNSPIVKALETAAQNGKQVTVLLEVKARFDEENNIHWAKQLERAGAHVVYGLVGLKTHCKITLVVRLEDGIIKRYVHVGTGNYNDETAKLYTDLSLFTSNEAIGADASAVFNMLTGFSQRTVLNELIMAPNGMREKIIENIDRETQHALKGKGGHIIAKANALTDPAIVKAFYRAADAGVKVELIIRGKCCLNPGIEGFKKPIKVISIVGRFLEHSRVMYFKNGGNAKVYISSADFMPRNLDHRVELMSPVNDPKLREKLIIMLKTMLKDNVKARSLRSDGKYLKVRSRAEHFDVQEYFLEEALKNAKIEIPELHAKFVPIHSSSELLGSNWENDEDEQI